MLLRFFPSIDTAWGDWARVVFYWVSSVRCLYNPTRGSRESALSFKASCPLIRSSVGSLRCQTPFWCLLRKLQWKLLEDTRRSSWTSPNVSKHSPSILANLLRLSDGSSRPSRAYIAVSLIINSLHIRRTSSYSRLSHAASHGLFFFLSTISLEHLESRACRKRCSYTRNCPTILQTGTPMVPESQVFPLTHHHRSLFHPLVSPEDWFELQIDAWKWLQLM